MLKYLVVNLERNSYGILTIRAPYSVRFPFLQFFNCIRDINKIFEMLTRQSSPPSTANPHQKRVSTNQKCWATKWALLVVFTGIIQAYDHENRTGTTTKQQKRYDSVLTLLHSFRFLPNFKNVIQCNYTSNSRYLMWLHQSPWCNFSGAFNARTCRGIGLIPSVFRK